MYKKVSVCLFLISCFIFTYEVFSYDKLWETTTNNFLYRARSEFDKKNYNSAIYYFRRYLRHNRNDNNVWNQLAVAYYFTGRAIKALKYLKHFKPSPTYFSYNYYYQGLCYYVLKKNLKAKKNLSKAARIRDQYGSEAVFELALIHYKAKEEQDALYWINLYLQNFPTFNHINTIMKMKNSLARGRYLNNIKENPKPDMKKALYKYNKFSLFSKPHFWFIQFGWDYWESGQKDPDPDTLAGVKDVPYSRINLILNGGIGLGPIETHNTLTALGYNYKQHWYSDITRITIWSEDPSDFSYFPFRADLLQRSHQLYGDLSQNINNFNWGIFGLVEFIRIGSSLIPGPEGDEIDQKVSDISKNFLTIPWIGYNFFKNHKTKFYLYLKQNYKYNNPEMSYKTFDFFSDDFSISSALEHSAYFSKYKLSINADLFRYDYTFNDPWMDHTRSGGNLGINIEFIPHLYLIGSIGMYQDKYDIPKLKQIKCSGLSEEDKNLDPSLPISCLRKDTGILYKIGIYIDYKKIYRVEMSYTSLQNQNPDLVVYDKTDNAFLLLITMAFPGIPDIYKYINNFNTNELVKAMD